MFGLLRRVAAAAMLLPLLGPASSAEVPTAADLATRYPVGSILTGEQARAAQLDADRADAVAQADWRDAQERCARVFFVTACRDQALKERREVEREARRIRVEANSMERRIDAEARAQRRAEQVVRAPTAEQRVDREAAARVEWEGRQRRALENAADRAQRESDATQRKNDLLKRVAEQQAREAERAAKQPARADNARQFSLRQREAARSAEARARERAVNEKRRSDRQRERERRMVDQGIVPPANATGTAALPADGAAVAGDASKRPSTPQ